MSTIPKRDIHQTVTDRIIASIEAGTTPWMKPWTSQGPTIRPLRSTGQPYNGVNVLTLWLDAEEKGFSSPYWFGFQTAHKMNACVRKGEKGSAIAYANKLIKTEENPTTGEEETRAIPFLKQSYVFNAAQIDGLPEHFYETATPPPDRTPKARDSPLDVESREVINLFSKEMRVRRLPLLHALYRRSVIQGLLRYVVVVKVYVAMECGF